MPRAVSKMQARRVRGTRGMAHAKSTGDERQPCAAKYWCDDSRGGGGGAGFVPAGLRQDLVAFLCVGEAGPGRPSTRGNAEAPGTQGAKGQAF
jgi:hypothetical protein